MNMQVKMVLLVILLITSGCATQRYGRLQNVTPSEVKQLNCEAIDLEIEKANAFIQATNDKDQEFTGKDVLGFLGDFGIGNAMEHSDAIVSATDRLRELNTIKKQKGCGAIAGK